MLSLRGFMNPVLWHLFWLLGSFFKLKWEARKVVSYCFWQKILMQLMRILLRWKVNEVCKNDALCCQKYMILERFMKTLSEFLHTLLKYFIKLLLILYFNRDIIIFNRHSYGVVFHNRNRWVLFPQFEHISLFNNHLSGISSHCLHLTCLQPSYKLQ